MTNMSFDQSTAVCEDARATVQDTAAAVNDDCCEVCLVAKRGAMWPPAFLCVVR